MIEEEYEITEIKGKSAFIRDTLIYVDYYDSMIKLVLGRLKRNGEWKTQAILIKKGLKSEVYEFRKKLMNEIRRED